jgi:hypothetical protein
MPKDVMGLPAEPRGKEPDTVCPKCGGKSEFDITGEYKCTACGCEYRVYYVNNDQTNNPGLHHEVHTEKHALKLNIKSKKRLGEFANEVEAVEYAKKHHYDDADGCAECCPDAHKG